MTAEEFKNSLEQLKELVKQNEERVCEIIEADYPDNGSLSNHRAAIRRLNAIEQKSIENDHAISRVIELIDEHWSDDPYGIDPFLELRVKESMALSEKEKSEEKCECVGAGHYPFCPKASK